MAKNKSNTIAVTASEKVSLPTNSENRIAVSVREWKRLKEKVDNLSDDTKKWEVALTSFLSVFVAFIIPVFSTETVTDGNKLNNLFLFYVLIAGFSLAGTITSFLAMRSHKDIREYNKKSILDYMDEIKGLYEDAEAEETNMSSTYSSSMNEDDLYDKAVSIAREAEKVSTSFLQRRMRIGYARAARIVEKMEEEGIAGKPDGPRARKILK